jgi:DNA-binding protein HU-beta
VRPAKFAKGEGVVRAPGSRINAKASNTSRAGRKPEAAGERRSIMKKKELIERIAQEADVPTGEAQRYFAAFEEVVTEALKAGEEVRITGFGKFSVKERKAREGRNPQTGQKKTIAAQKVPSFSAGNALREAV